MNLTEYIESVKQYPLPQNPMGQIRVLAKELAGGAAYNLWSFRIDVNLHKISETDDQARLVPANEAIQTYLKGRWSGFATFPDFMLLERMGYVSQESMSRFGAEYMLTAMAFLLVEETESEKIFISYKRSESSSFALLVMTMMKNAGLNPFLDLALIPGEDWSSGLKDRIESADYFVLLLGENTLSSKVVQDEIIWALDSNKIIMPIWHSGFIYQSGDWDNIPVKLDKLLSTTHTIRVLEENPLAYYNAILELLNRLGFTP